MKCQNCSRLRLCSNASCDLIDDRGNIDVCSFHVNPDGRFTPRRSGFHRTMMEIFALKRRGLEVHG